MYNSLCRLSYYKHLAKENIAFANYDTIFTMGYLYLGKYYNVVTVIIFLITAICPR